MRREPRRGDGERSFERLYRRHRADVYRALLRELGNREDAEDVMQTAFLDAYRALERGGRPERPRAWLLTIAENARRRRFRAQRRRPMEADLAYEPTAAEAEVTAAELRDALEQLPPNQRAALVLREVAGFSYAEIAARLELSVPSVQMLLFRARRALRAELEGLGGRRAFGLPAWPFPPWLAEGFHSSGGSLGVLPRAAGVVAAGAMGAAVVTGTATLPGARPQEGASASAHAAERRRGRSAGPAARRPRARRLPDANALGCHAADGASSDVRRSAACDAARSESVCLVNRRAPGRRVAVRRSGAGRARAWPDSARGGPASRGRAPGGAALAADRAGAARSDAARAGRAHAAGRAAAAASAAT